MFEIANKTTFFLDIEGLSNTRLQVLAFEGIESLNAEYVFEITLVNDYVRYDITQLLSKPAYLSFSSDKKQGIHGVIHAVKRGVVGKHYAEYKIVLAPYFTHLHKRINQRAFVGKTVPEIITTILEEHGILKGSDFEFKFKDSSIYQPREFCCQYHESDAAFVYRLCEECGIAMHYQHQQTAHQLILSDAQPFFPAVDNPIAYRPHSGFVADKPVFKRFDINLLPAAMMASERNYNFKNKKIPEAGYEGKQNDKANQAQEVKLEHYHFPGRLKDQDTASYQAQLSVERLRANHILAEAYSDVPLLHAGHFFSIEDFPAIETMNTDQPWLIKQIKHQGRQPQVLEAFGGTVSAESNFTPTLLLKYFKYPLADELQFPTEELQQGYRNCLVATPKAVPYRPARLHFKHKLLGTQTALVTGPADEEIYCDEYGRIKLQFHWDREGQYDEHSSHWIRVANIWAHDRYGGIEIPRIGMEVMVDFIEGDIDNPIVRGAVHNGVNQVPYDLPGIKTQSTLKSKEYKGGGYNEVLLDDTTGEVKTQVHSTPGTSQLTLGYLTHPRHSDGGGEHRGNGFELRTDDWGAVRAAKGIYVSANERGGASGNQLDLQEAIEQLEKALSIAQSLAEGAKTAETRQADTNDQQQQLTNVYTGLAQPSILASAPEGVAIVTPKTAQLSADNNITITSGKNTDISAQTDYRVTAGDAVSICSVQQEMNLVASKGEVRLQAQHNNMEIFANKNLKILSSEDRIEIAAEKEILLTSGGAYIRIKDGCIELHAPKIIDHKAASHPFSGPKKMDYDFRSYNPGNDEMFVLKDETGLPIPNFKYKIVREDGQEFYGVTNASGETVRVQTGVDKLKLTLFRDNRG